MIARKNAEAEIIQFNNTLHGFTRLLALVEFSVLAMMFIIREAPEGFDLVKNTRKNREQARFVDELG